MSAAFRSRARQRGNVMVFLAMMLPLVILPMVGLAIDATVCYLIQAKLSAAVDGASLGAGRLLGTNADPVEIATEFLNANFQTGVNGFWGANTLNKTITYTPGTTKTIFVDANVRVPLLFLRIIGKNYAIVSATATATRRDSRMVLVIDRSGSMNATQSDGNTAIEDVVSYAQGFTQKFTPGTDQVGLVVFDGSAVVGYPTNRPWDPTTTSTSTGGPDADFLSQGGTTCCDMVYQIKAINAANGTNMAEGLWLAYVELQKAHMKEIAASGVDTRLNSIVLFTDGMPGAVTVDLNNSSYSAIASGSPCTNKTNWPNKKMRGWIANGGSPPWAVATLPDTTHWPRMLASLDGNTANYWMSNAGVDYNTSNTETGNATPFANCTGMPGGGTSSATHVSDMTGIPTRDAYGNRMDTTDYQETEVLNTSGNVVTPSPVWDGSTALNRTKKDSAYHWGLAMWNATYQAAKNIRTDSNLANRPGDTQNMSVAIYTIGYAGTGGVDQGLLRAIANDKSADNYDASQATGMFVPATNPTALANAFTTVASAILRLKY